MLNRSKLSEFKSFESWSPFCRSQLKILKWAPPFPHEEKAKEAEIADDLRLLALWTLRYHSTSVTALSCRKSFPPHVNELADQIIAALAHLETVNNISQLYDQVSNLLQEKERLEKDFLQSSELGIGISDNESDIESKESNADETETETVAELTSHPCIRTVNTIIAERQKYKEFCVNVNLLFASATHSINAGSALGKFLKDKLYDSRLVNNELNSWFFNPKTSSSHSTGSSDDELTDAPVAGAPQQTF